MGYVYGERVYEVVIGGEDIPVSIERHASVTARGSVLKLDVERALDDDGRDVCALIAPRELSSITDSLTHYVEDVAY